MNLKIYILITFIGITVCGSAYFAINYYLQFSEQKVNEPSFVTNREILDIVTTGDWEKENERLKAIIDQKKSDPSNINMDLELAYSWALFNKGTETSKKEAVDRVKNIAEKATSSDYVLSSVIATLVNFAFNDFSSMSDSDAPFVYTLPINEILEFNPEYATLIKSNKGKDRLESVKILAEYSYNIYPNTYAGGIIAFWYGVNLSSPQDTNKLSTEEQVSKLNEILEKTDVLADNHINQKNVPKNWHKISYLYWKGRALVYAQSAGVVPKQSYEVAFKSALALGSGDDFKSTNLHHNIEPFILFRYASGLAILSDESRSKDISALLNQLVDFQTAGSGSDDGAIYFDKYLYSIKQGLKPGEKLEGPMLRFIEVSQPFKEYLIKQGWVL